MENKREELAEEVAVNEELVEMEVPEDANEGDEIVVEYKDARGTTHSVSGTVGSRSITVRVSITGGHTASSYITTVNGLDGYGGFEQLNHRGNVSAGSLMSLNKSLARGARFYFQTSTTGGAHVKASTVRF